VRRVTQAFVVALLVLGVIFFIRAAAFVVSSGPALLTPAGLCPPPEEPTCSSVAP
jgi:hypothetical protein